MNNIKLLMLLVPVILFSQQRLDGIAAVIGDEIVLDSDIEQIAQYSKSEGVDTSDNCKFIDQILMEKILTYQAKQDTMIIVDNDRIDEQVNFRINYFKERMGSDAAVLKEFNLQTMTELKTELKEFVTNQYYTEEKTKRINADLDVSPQELKDFYSQYQYDLPDVPEEIELAHIVIYPELTEDHKQEMIDQLNGYKSRIEAGESFESLARLYSEDEGSAKKGGQYQNVKRGKMVKQFDAVAFNLDEGKISEPFETEFGYHIIKLEKRRGQILDLRHILIKSTPSEEEIKTAKNKLDSIRTLIKEEKYTFKEAAFKFSDDKLTRFNAGVLTNPESGEDKLDKLKLSTDEFYEIAGLGKGDLTEAFDTEYQNKKVARMLQINNIIDAHKLSLDQDYNRIKNYALNKKKQEVLEKFVKEQIPETNIVISNQYKSCTYSHDWLQEGDID